jgi:hypothetical protein
VVLFVTHDDDVDAKGLPASWTYGGTEAGPDQLLAAVPDLDRRKVLVSGSPSFIAGIRSTVRKAGVPRVLTDAFLGY